MYSVGEKVSLCLEEQLKYIRAYVALILHFTKRHIFDLFITHNFSTVFSKIEMYKIV